MYSRYVEVIVDCSNCILLYCNVVWQKSAVSSDQCQDGDVRLANGTIGPGTIEGRVEICYGGVWSMLQLVHHGH